MQKSKLSTSISTLEQQARHALELNREGLARQALERKNTISMQIQNLDKQILDMQAEQYKLENTEKRLSAKVQEFKTRKEVIKAQYSSAKAQVKITESITGISEEMQDVGMALDRAEDKTQKMKAKAQALDEMIDTGVLTDYTASQGIGGGADIGAELDKLSMQQSVDQELAKMKAEHKAVQRGKMDTSSSSLSANNNNNDNLTIVRVAGHGQFKVNQSTVDKINEIDNEIVDILKKDIHNNIVAKNQFRNKIEEMVSLITREGEPLDHKEIVQSDVIVPSADLSVEILGYC
jgi:phage shock protein A